MILAISFFLYYAVYLFVESTFFATTPDMIPTDKIRNLYAIALVFLYFAFLRTKASDLIKAIILIAPVAMSVVAVILALYLMPVLAVASVTLIAIGWIFLLYQYKKPWIYFYAAAIALVAGIAYAWPREIINALP